MSNSGLKERKMFRALCSLKKARLERVDAEDCALGKFMVFDLRCEQYVEISNMDISRPRKYEENRMVLLPFKASPRGFKLPNADIFKRHEQSDRAIEMHVLSSPTACLKAH